MGYEDEFPCLKPLGLYPADIIGDGNCLFSALSDQLFGAPDKQRMIRATTIEYMRANADHYKSFLEVHAGGGTRRNPRRGKSASESQDSNAPTEADIDRAFENHLKNMARGGVYGDNHEIVAFCCAFRVAVKVYEADFAYMIQPQSVQPTYTCHIAHHTWEHYSSVRYVHGPRTGWPMIDGQGPPPQENLDPVIEAAPRYSADGASFPGSPYKEQWKVSIVEKSLPHIVDRATIIRTLEESGGDEQAVIERLLNVNEELPSSQSGRSSSPDSSDSYSVSTPKKKQDRRQSRASKSARRLKIKEDTRRDELAARVQGSFSGSLEALEKATIQSSPVQPKYKRPNWIILNHTDDEKETSPPPTLKDGNTSESSVYSEVPAAATKPPILRLKHTTAIGKNPLAGKKLNSSRDIKMAKKREQKLASKERKLLEKSGSSKRPLDQTNVNVHAYPQAPAMVKTASNPGITNAIRVLHV